MGSVDRQPPGHEDAAEPGELADGLVGDDVLDREEQHRGARREHVPQMASERVVAGNVAPAQRAAAASPGRLLGRVLEQGLDEQDPEHAPPGPAGRAVVGGQVEGAGAVPAHHGHGVRVHGDVERHPPNVFGGRAGRALVREGDCDKGGHDSSRHPPEAAVLLRG
jgi:hypothetical protein